MIQDIWDKILCNIQLIFSSKRKKKKRDRQEEILLIIDRMI